MVNNLLKWPQRQFLNSGSQKLRVRVVYHTAAGFKVPFSKTEDLLSPCKFIQ